MVADRDAPLGPADLESLAEAAYLAGDDAAFARARARAYSAFLEQGDQIGAARCACRLAHSLLSDPSQRAQGAGWLARARRLLEDCQEPCVEQGWLLAATAFQRITEGDITGALPLFSQAADAGVQFGNADLVALGRHGHGRALLFMGRTDEGFALLDEVMLDVTGGGVGPAVAGVVYCSVINACH